MDAGQFWLEAAHIAKHRFSVRAVKNKAVTKR
jgi:hypothetical protein